MDETWVLINNRDTKEQSKEKRQWFPVSNKFKTKKSSSKFLTSAFCDEDGILLVDYLEKSAVITTKYCIALFEKLKQKLASKRGSKLSKGILFLQDNAAFHKAAITHKQFGRSSL
jgi:hypothetical protein